MGIPKAGKSQKNQTMHYSVGALIKKDDKFLLIDRVKLPYGFAGIAGHIDEGESELKALTREVEEESGLKVTEHALLLEEELDWNWCSKGIDVHYWYLFECEVTGELKRNYTETKSVGWYSKAEIKQLKLEPVWEYWFEKLKII